MKTSPGYGSAPVESKLNTKVRYLDKPHFVSYLHLDIQKQNLRISRIRCRYKLAYSPLFGEEPPYYPFCAHAASEKGRRQYHLEERAFASVMACPKCLGVSRFPAWPRWHRAWLCQQDLVPLCWKSMIMTKPVVRNI